MKCPDCRNELPMDSKFCSNCGYSFVLDYPTSVKKSSSRIPARKIQFIAVVIVGIMMISAIALYLNSYSNEESNRDTINIYYLDGGVADTIYYEVRLNDTGEMLMEGDISPDQSATYHFQGYLNEQIVFWYSIFPEQTWIISELLSEGQHLSFIIYPSGALGWAIATYI